MTARRVTPRFDYPVPCGAILQEGGVYFVVFSRSATAMRVLLYDRLEDREPAEVIDFHPELNRWGDMWSMFVPDIRAGQLYHFQADGPFDPQHGQWFDATKRLIDPYAKALAGEFQPSDDGIIRPPRCVVIDEEFDWQGDRHLCRPLADTVIYEMHVRGFTCSPSSGVKEPGTYRGVIEKIPYLHSLGVTAVELMPVHEFSSVDHQGKMPARWNYWGYDPIAFFSPHRGYGSGTEPGCQVREFKEMVLALHKAGIEVILDVVFNHTAEGNERGPVLSFKGLENRVYYMLENGGSSYRNYSGCGNTVNGNHPIVRDMIFHCLRHWVHNYHVDGFRFDLASILSRNREGQLVPNPPLLESISEDPLLADTKIIAEAWDAAGAYQVGGFGNRRWAEWNGRYRDDVRRFWRGDSHMLGAVATRIAGSSDLYQSSGRHPYHSINFVTAHDGFTLHDLVSYNQKHNEDNLEGNRDGDNNSFSFNCGAEGPTDNRYTERIRGRLIRNFFATLLLSQGVPMMLFGDEARRTQRGNNNAWCQDNEVSWFDWQLPRKHQGLQRFVRALLGFRTAEPTLRQRDFFAGKSTRADQLPDVAWFGPDSGQADWDHGQSLICFRSALAPQNALDPPNHHILLMLHAGAAARRFAIPESLRGLKWQFFINTAARSPNDIYPELNGPAAPDDGNVAMEARTLVCLLAKDES